MKPPSPSRPSTSLLALPVALVLALCGPGPALSEPAAPGWDSFHGQLNAQKYSPLDQINADNGVLDVNKQNSIHAKWSLSLLQPPP